MRAKTSHTLRSQDLTTGDFNDTTPNSLSRIIRGWCAHDGLDSHDTRTPSHGMNCITNTHTSSVNSPPRTIDQKRRLSAIVQDRSPTELIGRFVLDRTSIPRYPSDPIPDPLKASRYHFFRNSSTDDIPSRSSRSQFD
jgi:hypothetical protein